MLRISERQQPFGAEQIALLADIIEEMSEEIFEHYKALLDILKEELANIRKQRQETGTYSFLSDADRMSAHIRSGEGWTTRHFTLGEI